MDALTSLTARLSNRLAMHFPVTPFRMRNHAPLVTVTFDDAPASAAALGAPMLERYGGRGTFYVASGLLGDAMESGPLLDTDGLAALHRAGHEIALHTHTHRSFATLSGGEVEEEIARNRAALQAIEPTLSLQNFAYPYGMASLAGKRRLGRLVRSSRGIMAGVNSGRIDLQYLRAVPLYDGAIDPVGVERWLEEAVARRGWLVFFTHDVAAAPSPYGCSPDLLAAVLQGAARRGLASVTVSEALARIGAVAPSATTAPPVSAAA